MPYVVLILSQLAVGSAAILARTGLQAGLTALDLTAWRLVLASALLLPLLWVRRQVPSGLSMDTNTRLRLTVAGVALAGHFWAWFASLEHVSVARSTLLVSTTPIWAALGSWLVLRSCPSRRFWFGLALALVGAWMVTGGPSAHETVRPGGVPVLGDGLALLGAVLIAVYFLMTSDLQRGIGTARVIAWTYPSAAVTMLVAAVIGSRAMAVPADSRAWASVVGMAVLPQLLGHTMLNWSLRHFSAAVVGTATLLEPVFAGALAWLILCERLGGLQLFGAALLLTGVWAVLRSADPAAGCVAGE